MKIIKIRRLWRGIASVRSTIVDDCYKNNRSIQLVLKDETMTLSPREINEKGFQTSPGKTFESQYGTESYRLIDFKWKPDEKKKKIPQNKGQEPTLDFG
jgi:hypothetical protein